MLKIFSRSQCVAIFIVSFIVLMACQYTTAYIDYNVRFVVFVQNALAHGLTYFPMAHTGPYPDYPIGNTFLLYLAALPFGKISIFTIGIPYCLSAAFTSVLIYKVGALHNKKWGLYAVLFSLFTWQYVYNIHNIAVDVYPVLATIFCFYLVYSAKLKGTNKRLWFLPVALLFGLFTRGPIGLVVPAVVVGCFYLLNKDWWSFIKFSIVAGVLLLLGFALLLLGAYLQGGQQFMHQVWMKEAFGRVENYHKSRLYYYFSVGLLPYIFTLFFAIVVVVKKFKTILRPSSEQLKLLQYLVVWAIVMIVGFTIPDSKQTRYILAITPAISLLAAYIFVEVEKFQITRRVLLKLCFFMPVFGFIIIAGALIHNHYAVTQWQGYLLPAFVVLLGLFVVNVVLARSHMMFRFGLGVAAFLVIAVLLLFPMIMHHKIPSESFEQVIFLPFWPF